MRYTLPVITAFGVLAMLLVVPVTSADAQVHEYITSWGSLGGAGDAKFSGPTGAGVDYLGNIYVADTGNSKIQKYNNVGGFIAEWNNVNNGTLVSPMSIDIADNMVYVADKSLDAVIVYDLDGNYQFSWGQKGTEDGKFVLPFGIDVYENIVYVADTGNSRIQSFTLDGQHVLTFGNNSELESPVGIVAMQDGTVFVSDPTNMKIYHYNSAGELIAEIDRTVGGVPLGGHGMALDGDGGLYVADSRNNRIVHLDSSGTSTSVWGTYGTGIYQFILPTDVIVDQYGQLFVIDSGSHSVRKFTTPDTIYGDERRAVMDAATTIHDAPIPEALSIIPETLSASITTNKQYSEPAITAVPGDITRPIIHAPRDITIEAVGILTIIDIGIATASDASGILSIENNAPDAFTLGINTVIWTAIDGAHNTAIDTQTITIVDTIPPVIWEIENIVFEATSPDRNYINIRAPVATDTVGVLDITSDAPEYFEMGRTAVTWTAHDIAGNTASTSHYVTITDTTAPMIGAPQDIISEATSIDENDVFLGDPIVTDNGKVISITNDAPQRFSLGTTSVIWTVADSHGHVAHDTQLVTLTDTTAPIVDELTDIVIEATSTTQNIVELAKPTVSDIQDVKFENDAPAIYPIGETIVTWTLTDANDLTTSVEQLVTLIDSTAPLVDIQSTIIAEATGYDSNLIVLGDITVSDISDIASISSDAPETFTLGTTTVSWHVTDIYNNTGVAVQNVEVQDTTPPSIFAPTDITVEYAQDGADTIEIGIPVVADLVGIADINNNAPAEFEFGITEVLWSATDQSGNQAFAIQTISVIDTLAPVMIAPDDILVEATSRTGTPVKLVALTAADESGTVSIDNNAPVLFELGTTVVTWSVTDLSGNTATTAQIIVVKDTTPPRLHIPSNVTTEAKAQHQNVVNIGTATGYDSASDTVISNNAPDTYSVGTTTITWTAADSSANITSKTQTVTLIDTTSPEITAPKDVMAEAKEGGTQLDIGTPKVFDTVSIESVTNDAPELFDVGLTTVTWTVTDSSANTNTDTQLIAVADTIAPLLITPLGFTHEATSATHNIIDIGTASYTDVSDIVAVTNNAPEFFALGDTIVLWTVTDDSGNERTTSQTIRLVDTTSPRIIAPPRIGAEATSHDATVVDIGIASAVDIVGIESISNNAPVAFELGTTIVTWTATDTSGNMASATQQIIITDTTPPVLEIPDDIVLEAISSEPIHVDIGTPVSTDLGSSKVTITNNAPDLFELGRTRVIWTASDPAANITSLVQTVTIVDTTAPHLVAPDDLVVEADSSFSTMVHVGTPVTSDNTGIVEITNDAPEVFPIGTTIVTWTIKDTSGITTSQTQRVDVIDTTPPRVFLTSDITAEAISSNGTPVMLEPPYTSDSIGVVSVRNDAPELFNIGKTLVMWTVTDEAENAAVAYQTVTITDSTAPFISEPKDMVVNATSPFTRLNFEVPTVSDTIDKDPVITTDIPDTYPLGVTTITWNAVDGSGNIGTVTQSVIVLACGKSHTAYNPISGTGLDDALDGTDGADLIFGGDGDDVINGNNGDDCIFGGDGDDIIIGGRGNDIIDGGHGDDVIRGLQGDDSLTGSSGIDIINGGSGINICANPDGKDAISRCDS